MKKIVVLDGYTLNPGDLSWDALKKIAPIEVHDRTEPAKILERWWRLHAHVQPL